MHGLYFLPYYVYFWSIYWSVDLGTAGHLNYLCTVAELHPAEPCDWICNFNKRFVIAPQTIQRKSRRWRTCWISWWVGFGRNIIWLNASQHELCNILVRALYRALQGGLSKSPVWISKLGMSLFLKVPVLLSEFQHDVTTSLLTQFGRKLYQTSILYIRDCGARFWVRGAWADRLWALLS